MNIKAIVTSVKIVASKVGVVLKRNAPTILMAAGVTGAGGALVLGCIESTKAGAIVDEYHKDMATIEKAKEIATPDEYSEADEKKDRCIVYIKTAKKFIKLYAPMVIAFIASCALILASHGILKARYSTLAGVTATLAESFDSYRKGVIDKYGEDVDKELRFGKPETVVDVTDPENPKTTENVVESVKENPYILYFDETTSKYWDRNMDYNEFNARSWESKLDALFRAKKDLFVNDVRDIFGMTKTQEGQIMGWHYDPNDESLDNRINLRMTTINRKLEDGRIIPSIRFDMNCDADNMCRLKK